MTDPASSMAAEFIADIRDAFIDQKRAAEKAIAQLAPADLFRAGTVEENSIAVLLKHIGGNLRSRWTRPFETDGEKPDRNRDGEFEAEQETPDAIRAVWDEGWNVLERTLAALEPSDLQRSVRIRGEQVPLIRALHRSLAHTAQHVGQIILLAKQQRGEDWQTLSIPRGASALYVDRPPA